MYRFLDLKWTLRSSTLSYSEGTETQKDEVINSKSLSKLLTAPVVLIQFKTISTFILFLEYLYETIKNFITRIIFQVHSI